MAIKQRHLVHEFKLVKKVISGRFQFDTLFLIDLTAKNFMLEFRSTTQIKDFLRFRMVIDFMYFTLLKSSTKLW